LGERLPVFWRAGEGSGLAKKERGGNSINADLPQTQRRYLGEVGRKKIKARGAAGAPLKRWEGRGEIY